MTKEQESKWPKDHHLEVETLDGECYRWVFSDLKLDELLALIKNHLGEPDTIRL